MKIWVDGDACPADIKSILFRAAHRTQTHLTIIANHYLRTPPSAFIKFIQVRAGYDVADNYIIQHLLRHDLVVTADIPLAHAAVQKNAFALNPRGTLYTEHNIQETLALRNLHDTLRATGALKGGPPPLSPQEITQFANALDKMLRANPS